MWLLQHRQQALGNLLGKEDMEIEQKITVIVPMYNMVDYVNPLLETLMLQDARLITILFVDDGSTDGTFFELQKALEIGGLKAPWQILRKSNGGLSDARNFGLANTRTEYVTFLDPDDALSEGFYGVMYRRMIETKSNVAISSSMEIWPNGQQERETIYDERTHCIEGGLEWLVQYDWSACTKVFKRSLFDKSRFDTGLRFEDLALIPFIIAIGNRLCTSSEAIYFYHRRPGSIMMSKDIDKEYEIFQSLEMIIKRLNSLDQYVLVWCLVTKVIVTSFVPSITSRYSPKLSREFSLRAKSFLTTEANLNCRTGAGIKLSIITNLFLANPTFMRFALMYMRRLSHWGVLK